MHKRGDIMLTLIGIIGAPIILGGVAYLIGSSDRINNNTSAPTEGTETSDKIVKFDYWEELAFIISVYDYFAFKNNNKSKFEDIPKLNIDEPFVAVLKPIVETIKQICNHNAIDEFDRDLNVLFGSFDDCQFVKKTKEYIYQYSRLKALNNEESEKICQNILKNFDLLLSCYQEIKNHMDKQIIGTTALDVKIYGKLLQEKKDFLEFKNKHAVKGE